MSAQDRRLRGRNANRTGLAGERAARALLERLGMTILAERARTPHGELDIVARDLGSLVFVEVKARPTRAEAAFAVSPRQARRIGEAALHWAAEHGEADAPLRVDVVLVDGQGRAEHLVDAVRFDEW